MILPMIGIGTVRFLLALAVLFLHADFVAFAVAQIAVLTFFYISGFLMERAYQRYDSSWRFLANRALRLIPTYLVVATTTWIIIALGDEDFRRSFGFIYLRPAVSYGDGIRPPLDSFGAVEIDWSVPYFGFDSELVPQAWSIGNELVYYLIVPILALLAMRWLYLILLISICFLSFQIVSRFENFDYEIYTNLLATLCFFLLGLLISRQVMRRPPAARWIQMTARWLVIALITLSYFLEFPDSISPLLVIGAVLMLIPLTTLGYLSPSTPEEGKVSRVLGHLSYPLYLSHMITIGVLNYFSLVNPLTVTLASSSLALMLYLIFERPVDRLRMTIRSGGVRG